MQKDLKTGMALGLVLAAAAVIWLSTRPSLSTKARMLRSHNAGSMQESAEQPRFVTNLPNTSSTRTSPIIETEQVNTPQLPMRKQAKQAKRRLFHTVRDGETLSNISYQYYGSTNKWKKIRDANRIKDANKIRPGTRLIIPD